MRPEVKTRRPAPARRSRDSAGPKPEGYPAREAAFRAVATVLGTGSSLDDALAQGGERDPLARAIAVTTFRRLGTIGNALHARLKEGVSPDERAFALLATGTAQILFLSVPDHAVVDLAVELARDDPKLRHLTGLVNAVLRRVAREREAILAGPADPSREAPLWLAERWTAFYGHETTAAMAAAHLAGAAVDLTVRSDPAGWAERLGGTLLPTGSVRLADRGAVTAMPGFAEGDGGYRTPPPHCQPGSWPSALAGACWTSALRRAGRRRSSPRPARPSRRSTVRTHASDASRPTSSGSGWTPRSSARTPSPSGRPSSSTRSSSTRPALRPARSGAIRTWPGRRSRPTSRPW